VKDARLDSREARLKLPISHEQYWRLIHEGLHLGYRKGARGGIWYMRFFNEPTKHYIKKHLAKQMIVTRAIVRIFSLSNKHK
jgi:hypothetical protein